MKKITLTMSGMAVVAFVVIWALLLPTRLSVDPSMTFLDDGASYSNAAKHLAQSGMYSLDGVTPFFAREPGMSVFLAGIYTVFGIENRTAIFVIQGLIVLCAALFFAGELRKQWSERVAGIFLWLLVLTPPVYHVIYSPMREALSLALALTLMAFVMRLIRAGEWRDAAGAGVSLGLLILSYTSFLLIPIALPVLLLIYRVDWKKILLLVALTGAVMAPWGIRNYMHTGNLCLTGCNRAALQWYVRGVQVSKVSGMEPFYCLWSEYVSRDWTGRSDACSFNSVMTRRWPGGFKATPEDIQAGEDGKKIIFDNFGNYLWLSAVDVIELHLPYVNGWGRTYNMLSILSMLVIYIGMALSIPFWLDRRAWPFLAVIAYNTGVYALTDTTPRYLLPVIFCYMVLSAVGYVRIYGFSKHRHTGS